MHVHLYIRISSLETSKQNINTASCSVPLGSSLHEDSAASRRDRANTTRQGTRISVPPPCTTCPVTPVAVVSLSPCGDSVRCSGVFHALSSPYC